MSYVGNKLRSWALYSVYKCLDLSVPYRGFLVEPISNSMAYQPCLPAPPLLFGPTLYHPLPSTPGYYSELTGRIRIRIPLSVIVSVPLILLLIISKEPTYVCTLLRTIQPDMRHL